MLLLKLLLVICPCISLHRLSFSCRELCHMHPLEIQQIYKLFIKDAILLFSQNSACFFKSNSTILFFQYIKATKSINYTKNQFKLPHKYILCFKLQSSRSKGRQQINYSLQNINLISYIYLPEMNKTSESVKSKSLKAKYVAKRPEIDESLFGIRTNMPKRDEEELKKVAQLVKEKNYNHRQLAVLKQDDLTRMKETIRKPTKEEEALQKKMAEEEKEYKLALAKAKKEQMLRLEEEKKKNLPQSDIEQEKQQYKNSIQGRAIEAAHEELDDVKQMNKMVAYAKAATIREKQLEEKSRDWDLYKVQEKKKDKMMEIQRLKKIRELEEIEQHRKEEALKGKEVIIEQIKARQIDRLRMREEQEREGQILVQKMKQLQKEEELLNERKREKQNKINDQIIQANRNALLVIEQRKLKEKEEEEKITQYIKEKSDKEAEITAEHKRIKEEKEKEIQRLRELQEKASDRQAELDALRAKRAIEANERAAREKDRIQAEIRAKKALQLQQARIEQQLEKERRLEEQAKAEKAEFESAVRKQKQLKETEQKLQKERKELLKKHAKELKKQIIDKEENKEQSSKIKEIENKKFQENWEAQKTLVEKIKVEKINQLKSLSIPDKYIVELQSKPIK